MAKERQSRQTPANPSNRKGVGIDEPGGEVLTISVTVNNVLKYHRTCALTTIQGSSVGRYVTDDGDTLTHNRTLGYKELARKLLTK